MIELAVPDLRGREGEYLQACITDNWVSSAGPFVSDFEATVAARCGRGHGIACVNGTAALHVGLLALGVKPGDHVIVPDWTFAASVNAVVHAGAIPIFADVSESDWCLDADSVDAAMRQYGDRVRAIVVVDSIGKAASPALFSTLKQRYGIPILEDAAGAIGAHRDGALAGGLGTAAVISFNGNKTVTAGGGGMVLCDDADVAQRVRHLTTQARSGQDYRHDAVGFNYRLTNVNAAIGLAQMERMDEMVAAKRAIADGYRAALEQRDDIRFMPYDSDGSVDSGWLSCIRVADEPAMRDLVRHLNERRIAARPFWCSLSAQSPYADYPRMDVPVSRFLTDRVLTLPSSSHLTAEQQSTVLQALADWRGPAMDRD